MTKKKIFALVVALAVVGAVGYGAGAATKGAAEPVRQYPTMVQGSQMMGNVDAKSMADMMNSPQMQKQCIEYMKSPEMRQAMINTMKQPEMQAAMKQMLQQDAGFHQMMLDLVNSVDMNMDHGAVDAPASGSGPSDHSMHHQ